MTKPRGTVWKNMSVEQKVEQVRKLAREGLSASAIAQRIPGDASRNAIISFTHRYGIKLARSQGPRTPAIKKSEAKAVPVRKPQTMKVVVKPEAAVPMEPSLEIRKLAPAVPSTSGNPSRPFDPLPGVEPVRIEDMPRLGCCRWPVNGDGREAIFCGCVTVPNIQIYCEVHTRYARPKEVSHGANS